MKKTIVLTILAVLFSVSSFAQQKPVTAAKPEAPAVVVKDFSGKVDSIILADTVKNIKPQLVTLDEKNAKVTFIVSDKAMIMNAAGEMVTLEKIAKGLNVVVKYHVSASGANEATDITIVKVK
jgi:hypothetical protein